MSLAGRCVKSLLSKMRLEAAQTLVTELPAAPSRPSVETDDPLKGARERAEGLIRVSELRSDGSRTRCPIPKTEDRAITLAQLERLLNYIGGHGNAEGWTSCNPATPGLKLKPESIDLYNFVFWVVKPATKEENCSYVELVATSAQVPTWFVSHWWGEPVLHFVACLRGHMRDRMLPPTTCYWVCAYANNQWQAGDEVGDNPARSSFRRAIEKSVGTITVLDDSAKTYTRIWCSYEIFVTLTTKRADTKYLYDVYTAIANGSDAVGLTDGPVAVDWKMQVMKSAREKKFPIELIQKGIDSDVIKAQASEEADRIHILNTVAGSKDLNATPPDHHQSYNVLNGRLRTCFATRSLRSIDNEDIAAKCAEVMRQSRSEEMTLEFFDVKDEALVLYVVQNGLPDSLRSFFITWMSSTLGEKFVGVAEAIQGLRFLTGLWIVVSGANIGVAGGLALGTAIGDLRCLTTVALWLSGNNLGAMGVASIISAVGRLPALAEFELTLANSGLEDDVAASLADTVRAMPAVKKVLLGLVMNEFTDEGKAKLKELEAELKARVEPVNIAVFL